MIRTRYSTYAVVRDFSRGECRWDAAEKEVAAYAEAERLHEIEAWERVWKEARKHGDHRVEEVAKMKMANATVPEPRVSGVHEATDALVRHVGSDSALAQAIKGMNLGDRITTDQSRAIDRLLDVERGRAASMHVPSRRRAAQQQQRMDHQQETLRLLIAVLQAGQGPAVSTPNWWESSRSGWWHWEKDCRTIETAATEATPRDHPHGRRCGICRPASFVPGGRSFTSIPERSNATGGAPGTGKRR